MINKLTKLTTFIGIVLLSLSFQSAHAGPDTESTLPENIETESEQAVSPAKMLRQKGQEKGFLQLDIGEEKLNAVFAVERLGGNYGGVLILPDRDEGITDQGVIRTLINKLPDYGWSVMAIELNYDYQPQLFLSEEQTIDIDIAPADENAESEATLEQAEPVIEKPDDKEAPIKVDNLTRIQTSVTYLQQQNLPNLIVLSHGESLKEALRFVAADTRVFNAIINIGSTEDEAQFNQLPDDLTLLDVLASGQDLTATRTRKAEMKRLNKPYVQRLIPAQDKRFSGYHEPLVSTVSGWLFKQFVDKANKE